MGLLSRVGSNLAGKYGRGHGGGEMRASVGDMFAMGAPGAMAGGAAGYAVDEANGGNGMDGAMMGAAMGGALGPAVGMKRIVQAIAQELKRARPDVPEQAAMQAAEQVVQRNQASMKPEEFQKFLSEVLNSNRRFDGSGLGRGPFDGLDGGGL